MDGTFNAKERNQKLDWLKEEPEDGVCRILTNARCLSEGVDVPNLDAVMFLTPRSSEVDVVQSVGRVMRLAPGKEYGYIILPVVIPEGMSPEKALDDNKRYRAVWQVLRALRAHDDRFTATVNKIELNKSRPATIGFGHVDGEGRDHSPFRGAEQDGLDLSFAGSYRDAIYAKIVEKVGERRYWESWAEDVAQIAQQHIARIRGILSDPRNPATVQFEVFLEGLRGNLNDGITRDEAVEMLAQHLITRPVFEALFGGYDFAAHNPVAQAMERMLAVLEEHSLDTENSGLERFYASVRSRVEGIDNAEGRQRIILELYNKFFSSAFKRTADKLGIVYTPVEIVDFILRSADEVLREHFGQSLTDEGVHVLDGFTGTGTFLVRLLQLGLIEPHDLARKYVSELHANEILLLAYYIAAVNIETTYQDLRGALNQPGDYEPFPGLILTDTFQSWEKDDKLDETVFVQNNERLEQLKKLDIQVIVGNPPWSVGQKSANDNNQNERYPDLDEAIRDTYVARSTVKNKKSAYDSYIRAIKWASLRIKDRGVIAYVTNGGWLDSNTAAGMRMSLAEEFSDIYVYNLRGNFRDGDSENVFDVSVGVAVLILVKDAALPGTARIHYAQTPDGQRKQEKLAILAQVGSFAGLKEIPREITPDEYGDWLSQRSDDFHTFLPLTDVFDKYGPGFQTNRDAWVYNFDRLGLQQNMRKSADTYAASLAGVQEYDPTRIKWSSSLEQRFRRGESIEFVDRQPRVAIYRPFNKVYAYDDLRWIHRPGMVPSAFPEAGVENYGFYVVNPGSAKPFAALMVSDLPDLALYGSNAGQFFARYRYEEISEDDQDRPGQGDLLASMLGGGEDGVVGKHRRIDNITDHALALFRTAYGPQITKDDIFHYAYGLLHSPEYRETYAADLKKMLPHLPLVEDPWPFIRAGAELSELHRHYENLEPYPLDGLDAAPTQGQDPYTFYAVGEEMAFGPATAEQKERGERKARTVLRYNPRITLTGIPEEAHEYRLGSRSAVEWIMDRYHVKTDKKSGIVNDPNAWSREVGDPRYILDLVARVVTLSVRTREIVAQLPALKIRPQS